LLLPLADIEPWTATRILNDSIDPQDGKVREGTPVTISARVEGEIPSHATMHHRRPGGVWQSSTMRADDNNTDKFRFTIPQMSESFEYYLTAGDARSRSFNLEVVRPPQVKNLGIAYTPPPYTEQKKQVLSGTEGNISGLAGTRVDFELEATNPLAWARLLTRTGQTFELAPREDGKTWGVSFRLWEPNAKMVAGLSGKELNGPTSYQIKMQDTGGENNNDPLWRNIVLTPDQVPIVNVQAPERLGVQPDAVLPEFVIESRDDHGLASVRLLYRVNDGEPKILAEFDHSKGAPRLHTTDRFRWELRSAGLKVGQRVEYWAEALDRNNITGPGKGESRRLVLEVIDVVKAAETFDVKVLDYADELRAIIKIQKDTRIKTEQAGKFDPLVGQQTQVRVRSRKLARDMEHDGVPLATMVQALDELVAGPMAKAIKLLESGRDAQGADLAADFRKQTLPVQDRIIAVLEELLLRLERNEAARKELRKIEKKDKKEHEKLVNLLSQLIKDLGDLLKDQTELGSKFERLPKRDPDAMKDEMNKALKDLEELKKRAEKWAKGSVNELTKMPTGFVDDFKLRKDLNRIYEEIEKAAGPRPKSEKIEVSLEDLGAGLATKMKEDLEMWLADSPDAVKWVLEEPLNKKPMKIPEMPLPKALEDLVGDLLQKADEFDKEADDVTSAWGDNLDQAGWGVSDGPISSFSAKGKTGNDLPNTNEAQGRSGDGRRGKSSGQMVGDTSRALKGRQTPARVGNEKYEPGQLKQENQDDPAGATGGGKKAGAGRKGLQGGSPPDMVKDLGRLSAKQAGLRENYKQVAQKLDTAKVNSRRLTESFELMKAAEKDLADRKYDDASRKRKMGLEKLRGAFTDLDRSTVDRINRARNLSPEERKELLQSAADGYPPGYEALLKSYYKALSGSEK
jgi:hypothetical protein